MTDDVKIKKLPNLKFSHINSAENNRVFLYECRDGKVRIVPGWIAVGFGEAPWPGSTDGFAVMFEKQTPAEDEDNMFAPTHKHFPEGTRIWQHFNERWLKEL